MMGTNKHNFIITIIEVYQCVKSYVSTIQSMQSKNVRYLSNYLNKYVIKNKDNNYLWSRENKVCLKFIYKLHFNDSIYQCIR